MKEEISLIECAKATGATEILDLKHSMIADEINIKDRWILIGEGTFDDWRNPTSFHFSFFSPQLKRVREWNNGWSLEYTPSKKQLEEIKQILK